MVKNWHQSLTRHQATVTGLDMQGRRIAAPFHTIGDNYHPPAGE